MNLLKALILTAKIFFRSKVPLFSLIVNCLLAYVLLLWNGYYEVELLIILLNILTSLSLIYSEKFSLESALTGLRICGAKVNIMRSFISIYSLFLATFLTSVQIIQLRLLGLVEFVSVLIVSAIALSYINKKLIYS